MRIAWLGTGIMGRAMAANLAEAGHDVVVWNRTRDRAEGIAGTTVADTPDGAVAGRDAVVTMLVDAASVRDVVTADVARAMGDAVWLQMSTVGAEVDELAAFAAEHEVAFVDAPVAGTKGPAEQGTLTVLAAGPSELRERADEVFDVVGARTVWAGEEPGAASRLKLLVNGVLVAQVAAVAETLTAAEALGLDPDVLLAALEDGPLASMVTMGKGRTMRGSTDAPQFPLEHAGKDARLLVEAAAAAGLDLPVLAAIRDLYAEAADRGHARDDMAAVIHGLGDA